MKKELKIVYETFCQEVLYSNQHIRFAAILNRNGTRIAGGYRKKVSSLLTPDEIQMSLYYAKQRWENRGHLSHRLGAAKYSITEYEKVKQITVPIGKNRLLLISTEINANHTKILEKVSLLVGEYFRGLLLKKS